MPLLFLLPFAELESLRQYFHFQITEFDNPDTPKLKDSAAVTNQEYYITHHLRVCAAINKKFEALE